MSAGGPSRPYLCLDFGGTKVAAAVIDAATGVVEREARRPTPVQDGADGGLRAAFDAAAEVLGARPESDPALRGVGISFGGPVAADGRSVLRSMHVGAWSGVGLPELVARRFGLPAVMANDADAAAVGEATFGAGRDASTVLYVQVSTGIGAGLVIDGRLHRGRGGAGELGHVVVDPDGEACACGKRGCLESVAAGWALAGVARRLGTGSDAEALIDAARGGHPRARAAVDAAFSALGMAVANAVNLLDPDRVVVGGGIAQAADVLLPALGAALGEHVVPDLRDPERLVLSGLGTRAPLVGAAVLADRVEDAVQGTP
jgi:glucokinase